MPLRRFVIAHLTVVLRVLTPMVVYTTAFGNFGLLIMKNFSEY
jgi:hypothetical protein